MVAIGENSHRAARMKLNNFNFGRVKVPELREPTGDVMIPNTRALDVLSFVGFPQQV